MLIATILFLLIVIYIFCYRYLIKLSDATKTSFNPVIVMFKRRHKVIPQLVNIIEKYSDSQNTIMSVVIEKNAIAHNSTTIKERQNTENALAYAVVDMLDYSKNYPALYKDVDFLSARKTVNDADDNVKKAINNYNNSIEEFNNIIKKVPLSLVAESMGLKPKSKLDIKLIQQLDQIKY